MEGVYLCIYSPTPLAQENSPPMLPYFHEQINGKFILLIFLLSIPNK